ncbi:MAG TPA: hypothetical protein VH482_31795 [Thermomicrobiales bacterium]|jgi:hypothetical protein
MNHELWDVETGNMIDCYDREDDALALVRAAIVRFGASYAETLAFLFEDAVGNLTQIAAGAELAERAGSAQGQAA